MLGPGIKLKRNATGRSGNYFRGRVFQTYMRVKEEGKGVLLKETWENLPPGLDLGTGTRCHIYFRALVYVG